MFVRHALHLLCTVLLGARVCTTQFYVRRALLCRHGLSRNAILACPATTASWKLNRIMDNVTQQRLDDLLRRPSVVARIVVN
jgi:hypothetical protein